MQKKILVTLLALCMLLAVLPFALTAGAATETGTTVRDCVHELADGKCSVCGATAISTAADLVALMNGEAQSGNYYLADNIDMNGTTQASITSFSGVFDGNEKTISGLNTTYGLFAAATDAWIYDLTVEGTVGSDDATGVGGIVGNGTVTANQTLHIENCTNKCTITGKTYVGGIVGCIGTNSGSNANYGTVAIINCCNEGTISGTTQIGGVVGYTKTVGRVTITGCTNNGAVTASTDKDAGGILGCGWSTKSGTVGVLEASNCFNNGAIEGTTNVGGIVGRFYLEYVKAGCSASVVNCYNSGTVTSSTSATSVDAILANAASGSVYTNNYCNKGTTSTKGTAIDGEFIEIMDKDTFLDLMSTENSDNWDADNCYILRIDIDLTDETQNPIGDSTTPFTGAFVGNSHVISGINITGTADYVGLFGYAKNAKFHDLTIEGSVTAGDYEYVGGLVGNGVGLTIENCTNKCSVSGVKHVGGIAGYLTEDAVSTVSGCLNTGAITCEKGYVGGVVAYAYGVSSASHHTIQKCMNVGTVTEKGATRSDAGGILGIARNASAINCVNIGTVYGNGTCVGGILGRGYTSYAVSYCYNSGSVTCGGSENIGAIAGSAKSASVTKCYYSSGGTNANGTYVDIDDKANADTYTDWSADIWTFTSAGPRLTSYIVEIGTADEFIALTQNSDEWDDGNFYILTADIDLESVEGQTSIGNEATPFVGGFDGAGHTISGIKLTGTGNSVGLFGAVKNAEIYNLTVNGEVNGVKYVGGIVGDGNLVSGEFLYISGCTNACTVSGTQHVGGIVGIIGRAGSGNSSKGVATITGCCNTGAVSAANQVGGIAGYIYGLTADTHTITECMNMGTISGSLSSGNTDVGGILGIAWKANVSDCINTGEISGSSKCIGGIVGRGNEAYDVQHCYNSGSTTGSVSVGAIIGSDPKSCISTADNNYYSAGTDNSKGTSVSENPGDATQYSGLNDSDAWVITSEGPKLTYFGVKILTKVVETAANTVTVDLYAKSVTPFWGTQFTVTAPQGYTLTDVEPVTLSDDLTFTAVANDDGTYNQAHNMALCVLPEDSDELTNVTLAKATKVATLTFTVYPIAKENTITVESTKAYQKDGTVIAYHGVDATVTHTFTEDTTTTYGHGVTLASEYLLEYTVKKDDTDDTMENPYMVFTSTTADGTVTTTIVMPYEYNGKWRFSAPGIAAKNMGDTITGTLCYTKDGKLYKATTDEYNIVSYYTKMYAKYKGDTTYTAFCNLLNAMLNYGATAEAYFEYDTENSVGTSLPDDYVATDAVATENTDLGTETGETIKYSAYGSTAVLNQRIELVVSFTLNTGATAIDASELVFKGKYEDVKGTTRTFTISGNDFEVDAETNMITVYIDQIAAKDLRQMVTGALYQGDTQVSQSVTTSFECYATKADAAEKDICAAILAYVDAAKTYFTQPN